MLLLVHMVSKPLVAAALACTVALAQTSVSAPSFEAASVKPSPLAGGRFSMSGGPGTNDPGRITYENVPLRIVLLNAYDLPNYRLTGPDWLNTLRYDIAASLPTGTGKEQFQAMLRNLVETRFQMKLHRESKEMPVYALVVAKKTSRLKATTEQSAEGEIATPIPGEGPDGFPKLAMRSPGIVVETKNGTARISGKEIPIAKFADFLSGRTGRPVIDQTGLAGTFNFVLYFTPDGASAPDNTEPDIFAALQEQLGLRLESRKAPVEFLVIDHAEKVPTEN
jgi:uncharacterized protein (TIGR03435 family)